jgi:hypothetical protein
VSEIRLTTSEAARLAADRLRASETGFRFSKMRDWNRRQAERLQKMIEDGKTAPDAPKAEKRKTGVGVTYGEDAGGVTRFWVVDHDSGKTLAGPFDFFPDANAELVEIQMREIDL